MSTRGVVIFGVNNSKINYVRLAMLAAAFVKKNMPGTPITLISSDDSIHEYRYENTYVQEIMSLFDVVLLLPPMDSLFENTRKYKDTQYYGFEDRFMNEGRASVYDLSPYDETILIDCDYLVCSDRLSLCWDSHYDVMINQQARGLLHNELHENEVRLNPFGIKMYWATVIYFKKSERAKLLFKLVEHIKENWEFYRLTYEFPGNLFRNDYAFSIALHILNGFNEGDFSSPLPYPAIHTALDTDQFYGISNPNTLHFFAQCPKETWKYYAVKLKGIDVHCMNKISLLNNQTEIMEMLNE
jgi:hypothetical protein